MAIDAPPDDQATSELDFVRNWLDAIEQSEAEEKDWTKVAERSCETYRGGAPKDSAYEANLNTFNIFHSNVETMVPAIYNSTPIPDVRRRFNDPDPVSKDVCELLERGLSYQIDAYDFDHTILTAVRDMGIVSRGIARVRYEPKFGKDGLKSYEMATCEYVPWKSFRRGPAKVWSQVPWIAFEQYLSYREVEKLVADEKNKDEILKGLKFSYSAEPKKTPEQQADGKQRIGARARVWEIWDRDNKEVHFIAPDYTGQRLTTIPDPLELQDFWPMPRPLSAVSAPDSLVPIAPLQIYEHLLEELNIIQRRIMRLTGQLRVRGWYAALNADDMRLAANADDGEMIPLTGAETFVTQGTGLDKALAYWPLETIVAALKQLVEQREVIKATIYEVTGISDIVRGASDAKETATAQQIKTQWGSLRIQRMQAEVARFVRDLFRLKAEIMASKFDFSTFETMAGMTFPSEQEKAQAQQILQLQQQAQQPNMQPQPPDPMLQEVLSKPSKEQIEKLIRDDSTRGFRVDIESDSTIRGDLAKSQEQMSLFMQGTAQYLDAVSRAQGSIPPDLAIEIYAGFARSFRLGKQAEDALDRLADQAKNMADQPKPPSPEEMKAQLDQQKMQQELQIKQAELELKKVELQLKQQTEAAKLELEKQKAVLDAQIKQMAAEQEAQIKAAEAQQAAELKREEVIAKLHSEAQQAAIKQQAMQAEASQKLAIQGTEAQQRAQQTEMEFGQRSKMAEVEFRNKQKREDALAKAKADAEAGAVNARSEHEKNEREANKGKPVRLRVISRDKDGRAAETEFLQ